MNLKGIFVIGAALMVAAVLTPPAWSHHAHGNYTKETKDFEGVVTEIHAINPHSWIYLNVTDASGKTQMWALEGTGRGPMLELEKEGKSLKVGDKVKVRCHPLRDGGPGCLLGFVKHPDGSIRDYDAPKANEVQIEGF